MNRDMLELDLGRAILTSYDGAFLLAQYDGEGDGQTPAVGTLSPFGIDGRPRDPDADADGNAGRGATVLHAIEGRTEHVMVLGDPRCTELLPTLEKGSSRLYAHVTGDKVAWLRLDGATGSAKLRVPVGSGETTIEVNASTGDVTIAHQGGTTVTVKAATVELGAASGGTALAKAAPLVAWAASVVTAITALGGSCPPLTDPSCTKVNGT